MNGGKQYNRKNESLNINQTLKEKKEIEKESAWNKSRYSQNFINT